MDNITVENKAKELIDSGILEASIRNSNSIYHKYIHESYLKSEVAKQVDADQVEPVTQKIFEIAYNRGLVKDASWYVQHARIVAGVIVLMLIVVVGLIFQALGI